MNNLKTVVLLAAISGLLIAIGGALGGSGGVIMAGVFAVAMNFGSYWFSADIVLRMSRAREIERSEAPRLFATIEEIARAAQIPMPRVYLMDSDQPNAFATGRSPKHAAVAVTTGILRLLNERELRAVLGHEVAHVKNRDILTSSVVATIASAISMLAWFGFLFGGQRNLLASLFAMLIAPLAAAMIQAAISRTREYQADRDGARLVNDPEALASALRKLEMGARRTQPATSAAVTESTAHLYIVNPLAGMKISGGGLFSTHPPTEERVERLIRLRNSITG